MTIPFRTMVSLSVLSLSVITLGACARTSKPNVAASPATDPRNALKPGMYDAGVHVSNLRLLSSVRSAQSFGDEWNTDLAFTGKYVVQGNQNGPIVWDISNPSSPTLVVAYECPASQNDVSVYKNLLFVSAEAMNGRIDCKPGGVRQAVSTERMRGVRIFDITNIREPKLLTNVQTCRGSHTHTVLEDPKDRDNIYIYVSGSSPVRPNGEVSDCSNAPSADVASNRLRIEIIKVPLADPTKAAIVNRANIFTGLNAPTLHGPSAADLLQIEELKKSGKFFAFIPGMGIVEELPAEMVKPVIDNITKQRGGTVATAADSAAARPIVDNMVKMFMQQNGLGGDPTCKFNEMSQCHDITVYPALGIAGGACEGHGLLLDISNPVNPIRLDAVADSNFAYWHSATFNNDGTAMLFSDEWGGGTGAKCRVGDKPEWGANAIFDIVTNATTGKKSLKFRSYYKIPTYQTSNENCVAHNGSLIPIPGRDIMVQSWYQGGISVFDWTDTSHPQEIASFDRGPVDGSRMVTAGSWSVYWYNGHIVSSEIARGMDVAELVPSRFVSQNEIDAAKTVKWEQLNAQGQPKMVWPPSFPLAKAFTDQLERKGCATGAVSALRTQIAAAEKASGASRNSALEAAVSAAEGARDCDAKRTDLLKKALQDLRTPAM
ncbi:LVIVD repeat-containing protein [Gemmatimonas sp.]|uniref:LVIVD repeat-containing protein n=1 Tax=Gemmatimonas sp. TaxID=1962908 RepID=UPI003F722DFF